MPEKHDQTAESRAGVLGQKKKNFFSSFTYTGWGELLNVQEIQFFFLLHTQDGGSYIMHEKHDRTSESHAGVLGQKKNFFSSFTYTGWGEVILCLRNTIEQLNHILGFMEGKRIIFFLLLHTQDGGGVTLCMRNTIEQLNHTLGFLDRSKRIFFLSPKYFIIS